MTFVNVVVAMGISVGSGRCDCSRGDILQSTDSYNHCISIVNRGTYDSG